MTDKLKKISEKLKSKIFYNYNVGKLTWFRTGGSAKIFAIIENTNELEIILNEIKDEKFFILGAGSNLLIRDKGFDGVIIKLGRGFNIFTINENKLEVGASVLDINLSNFALKSHMQGFEFFSGIPGTVGGAVKMNAGCFGSETTDVIENVEIYNTNFEKNIINKNDLNLNYRSSNIKNDQIVSKVTFAINYGDPDEIKIKMQNIKSKRLLTQPIVNRTSGSTFKNPLDLYAAKLIEEAGCKGMSYGNAFVSDKHANFFINNGKATALDLENLGKLVIDKVHKKFNIILKWEVKIIGDK